ncbi:NAD(P)H-hydrate dehydratase [Nisaea acidiphila]|uniref:Bifunctional NAD(P)H-hydrate repair enzyme n=1 Tax=Nisaea acidiphila TaxID=1862145 RepID=A0A9J7ASW0_9PROT|nr:NAD(P)H-hydrate dehydratase [Nisaea acidiphila]UUX50262.1 NAD(P)H-hydrate dehydratase [Nisaea acidiphila]
MNELALLTVSEMGEADRMTIEGGMPGIDLIEAAGRSVAASIKERFATGPVLVACGPGNNGGDGFVVARLLRDDGWPVELVLLGDRDRLSGDAALAARTWDGPVGEMDPERLDGADILVDAVFGAGLARDIEGTAFDFLSDAKARVEQGALISVAVDIPSGVDGNSGAVRGVAVPAALTVTFFRKKPGHLLYPGRQLTGELVLADIGIGTDVLEDIGPAISENGPVLWRDQFPRAGAASHKYTRGHAVVSGGPMTGAGRLAARAARRIGAGLLSIAALPEHCDLYALDAPGAIVLPAPDLPAFEAILGDTRKNAVLVGPGHGLTGRTREFANAALRTNKAVVLDADALTAFAGNIEGLSRNISGPAVLTPHEGEFERLFRGLLGSKLERARAAASRTGAVLVLKGPDTVVAAPDGRAAINSNAPPWLATGGTGDVLAGTILGLLAQGMPPFEAAAAAVWINGAAADRFGPGLIAEDLPEIFPDILSEILVRATSDTKASSRDH